MVTLGEEDKRISLLYSDWVVKDGIDLGRCSASSLKLKGTVQRPISDDLAQLHCDQSFTNKEFTRGIYNDTFKTISKTISKTTSKNISKNNDASQCDTCNTTDSEPALTNKPKSKGGHIIMIRNWYETAHPKHFISSLDKEGDVKLQADTLAKLIVVFEHHRELFRRATAQRADESRIAAKCAKQKQQRAEAKAVALAKATSVADSYESLLHCENCKYDAWVKKAACYQLGGDLFPLSPDELTALSWPHVLAEEPTGVRRWSKFMNPNRFRWFNDAEKELAEKMWGDHDRLIKRLARTHKYGEKDNKRHRETYSKLTKEERKPINDRTDANKRRRVQKRREEGVKKCEGTGCGRILPIAEFEYAPCLAGVEDYHDGSRQSTTVKEQSVCRDCLRNHVDHQRAYYNRPSDPEYTREYEARPEVKEMRKAWAKSNPELVRDCQERYREKHREERNAKQKERLAEYRKTPEYARYKRLWSTQIEKRLREYKNGHYSNRDGYSQEMWKLSDEDAIALFSAPQCDYCGKQNGVCDNNGEGRLILGLDRISPLGNYELENVVPCCKICNRAKHIREWSEFVQLCCDIHEYQSTGHPARKKITWFKTHKQKVESDGSHFIPDGFNKYALSAKQRKMEFSLTEGHFNQIVSGVCHYCGVDSKLGVDRVNSSEGYTIQNCVACCTPCNMMKNNTEVTSFLHMAHNVARRHAYAIGKSRLLEGGQ